jgi:SpoVK/Ycf46/Vps4 family AAA+-type ATPase
MEAYAAASGRVVIELTGLRGMYFGQTDAIFEKLRLRIKTYGKVLILVDEAHTAFGSVHKPDTHETEKRLAGNIIKMMGDLTLFGKVLWGLMTSRPDELDPDVKSRAPIQIPIFDLEGDERKLFIKKLFAREKIEMSDDELEEVLKITAEYSNRDFSFLVKEVLGEDEPSVLKTLAHWQASKSILRQRKLQRMIAAQHCTYPILLPADLKDRVGTEEFEQELQRLTLSLHY